MHLYNTYHLGDCLLTLIFIYHERAHLLANAKDVTFYCNPLYISQLKDFVEDWNVCVKFMGLDAIPTNAIDTWMGHYRSILYSRPYDVFLLYYFNKLAEKCGLPPITALFYDDAGLLERYKTLPETFKEVDILFINSEPKSGQFTYNQLEWDAFATQLVTCGYKVACTTPIQIAPHIPCTISNGLSLKDIGSISTHAKCIIAVNSGPIIPCLNIFTICNVQSWFVFDATVSYAWPSIRMCRGIADIARAFLAGRGRCSQKN
jgi:hypothetical protein